MKQAITVAIAGARIPLEERHFNHKDYCFKLTPVDKVSSILDIHPDIVLSLVDSTDLNGTLYPTTKLIDMDIDVLVVLERYDELLATGHSLDYGTLARLIGRPVIVADFGRGDDMGTIAPHLETVIQQGCAKDVQVPYGADIEEEIAKLMNLIGGGGSDCARFSPRYMAVRLVEEETYISPYVQALENHEAIFRQARSSQESISREFGESSAVLVKKARHGFINGALQKTLRHSKDDSDHSLAQRLDAILTHRLLGLPILAAVLMLVFEMTFALGAYPQAWLDGLTDTLCMLLRAWLPQGWLADMAIDGIVQGVGTVISFLPNIIILFFFLSILEDSGYMARAAYIMDKMMHRIGLHGRSFVPMLIGFGCNVPAIMASKRISHRKDRILTMLMIPYMSCSARLPVYLLLISAFFAHHKALVLVSIYLTGILLSILLALVMKRTRYFHQGDKDYVCALPAFRMPTFRNTGLHIWERVSDYLRKITTVILTASVIIWMLEYFPSERTHHGRDKEESYLAMVGKWMAPAMEPLGFDWRMNVCILTGLPAKEAIVSAMGILYHSPQDRIDEAIRKAVHQTGPRAGQPVFTPAVGIAFMLFVLLYFPCIATIATLSREAGRGWAAFSVIHSLLLAWTVAFIAFRLCSWLFQQGLLAPG